MPRFVVLFHECPPSHPRASHWDLMFECDGTLRTWALATSPDAPAPQPAEALADHRLAYLDYEGPVSGDRGTVRRWDQGTYAVLVDRDDCLQVRLAGERLCGIYSLRRPTAEGRYWLFSADASELSSPRFK